MGALTGLPPGLLLGWALWLAGGLALTVWFRRQSAAPPRKTPTRKVRSATGIRVATSASSGSRIRAVQGAKTDVYGELQQMLDPPDRGPRDEANP